MCFEGAGDMALEREGYGICNFVKAVFRDRSALIATVLLFVATTILAIQESGLLDRAERVPSDYNQLVKIHVGTERAMNAIVQKER